MDKEKDIESRFGISGKNNPFKVPDTYFNDFSGRLQERLNTENIPLEKTRYERVFRPKFVYVLAVILLALIAYPLTRHFNPAINRNASNMAAMVDYSIENIETDLLIEGVSVSDMANPVNMQTSDTLIDYIESQGIELENITEQL
jgi:hypothetical protein